LRLNPDAKALPGAFGSWQAAIAEKLSHRIVRSLGLRIGRRVMSKWFQCWRTSVRAEAMRQIEEAKMRRTIVELRSSNQVKPQSTSTVNCCTTPPNVPRATFQAQSTKIRSIESDMWGLVVGGSQELSAEAAASKSANFLLKEQVEELTTALEASAEALQVEVARHSKELEEKLHEAVVNTRAQVEAEVKAEMDKRQWIIEVC
jgi:hypothetical protein